MASLAGLLNSAGSRSRAQTWRRIRRCRIFWRRSHPVSQPYSEANLKPRPDLVIVAMRFRAVILSWNMFWMSGYFCDPCRIFFLIFFTDAAATRRRGYAWQDHHHIHAGMDIPICRKRSVVSDRRDAENFGSSFALRQGQHFIIEGDEYDTAFFDKAPSSCTTFPQSVILTSVEFDHADIYADLNAVNLAFKRLVNLVPRKGRIIAYDANQNVDECIAKALCPVERYGLKEDSFWRITDLQFEPERTTWTVLRDGKEPVNFEFALAGEYNVLNATAAAAMAANYGLIRHRC